jgi:hypothetical protein
MKCTVAEGKEGLVEEGQLGTTRAACVYAPTIPDSVVSEAGRQSLRGSSLVRCLGRLVAVLERTHCDRVMDP